MLARESLELTRNEGDRIAQAGVLNMLAVSIPHKIEVIAHLDEIEATARVIGAVNTVTRKGDRLLGTNTDWIGAVRALETRAETKLAGTHAVVLGAGGTARAIVYGLRERGARVTVLNRTESKARDLADSLGGGAAGGLGDLGDLAYDVLVNATSVGLRGDSSPVAKNGLRREAVVMDAVYDPAETRLLTDARAAGARTVGGKWMLVLQAAEQLALWTGREPPIDVMADAFDAAGR